uniref:TFIIS-type domain-containing protein n=1 Tax=Guillardia theta TaxID=55529 RepID=A0A7S4N8I8_GUITH|mmetsp:Transcript_18363/g.60301  ORF Transcript_18363/g.60301 Transcript_18363/m.60301 type:complete len:141 (+) Transcript_18363:164-586(+)
MADDRQTSMQFCNECNNLMYPKEVKDETDPTESRLVYVCKAANCIVSAKSRKQCIDAESTMVWKHVVQHTMKADDFVNADITQDPTLPRTRHVTCSKCNHKEAVYLQAVSGPQQGISLYFVCCGCNHTWKQDGKSMSSME